jgi:hypothetical protein
VLEAPAERTTTQLPTVTAVRVEATCAVKDVDEV